MVGDEVGTVEAACDQKAVYRVQFVPVAGSRVSQARSVVKLGGEKPASWLCRSRGGTVDRSITLGAS